VVADLDAAGGGEADVGAGGEHEVSEIRGALGVAVHRLAQGGQRGAQLLGAGHGQAQVALVVPTLKGKAQEAPALDAMGVRVHSVDTASDAKTAKAIAALARESASEVIYERRYSPKIGASVSQTTGLPLVVEVNGLPDVEASILGTAPKRSRPEKAVRSLIRKTFYTRASKVVTVTRGLADALRDRYGLHVGEVLLGHHHVPPSCTSVPPSGLPMSRGAECDRLLPRPVRRWPRASTCVRLGWSQDMASRRGSCPRPTPRTRPP